MMLSLGQAARMCGKPKTTIARAIASGRLSAGRNDIGGYAIDPAELGRVYPFPAPGSTTSATDAAPGVLVRDAPPDATTDALVSTLREVLADMRQDRDHWRDVATRLALTDQRPRSWWRRLAG